MSMPQTRIFRWLALALTGVAVLAAAAVAADSGGLTPSAWDVIFDDVQVGETSAPQSVTLTNTEHGPVDIGRSVIIGPHPHDFLISSDSCSGKRLEDGQQCKLGIRFRPIEKGTRVGHLKIPHDGDGCAVWIVLAGSGPNREPSARTASCDQDIPTGAPVDSSSSTSNTAGSSNAPSSTTTSGSSLISLPAGKAARACTSRRIFRIRIHQPRGVRFKKVTVRLNKKLISVRRGKRVTAAVSLRGLPRGRFTLRVVATTTKGRQISRTRHYVTCVKNKG